MFRFTWLLGLAWLAGCTDSPSEWPFSLHSGQFPGPHSIRGTITLPDGVRTSGIAALTLTSAATASPYTTLAYVDEASLQDLGELSGSVDYTITGLAEGRYLVGCLINADGDSQPSAGDLGGYHDGTPAAPLLRASEARVVEVADQPLIGVDFGVGQLTCLAAYGEPCTADTDCGGTACSYSGTDRVRGLHTGTCDAETGVCVEASGECPLLDGESGVKSESGCFGAGPE